jgi:hypothetical protein
MASPQFHHLLEQIHKTSQTRKLAWQPVAKSRYSKKVAFRLALGEGVVRIEAEAEDDEHFSACYAATLSRRDGLLVDEARGAQFSSEDFTLLRDIYQAARAAAFNLDRMVDEMQADLEAGRVRELPPEEDALDDGIPF